MEDDCNSSSGLALLKGKQEHVVQQSALKQGDLVRDIIQTKGFVSCKGLLESPLPKVCRDVTICDEHLDILDPTLSRYLNATNNFG